MEAMFQMCLNLFMSESLIICIMWVFHVVIDVCVTCTHYCFCDHVGMHRVLIVVWFWWFYVFLGFSIHVGFSCVKA